MLYFIVLFTIERQIEKFEKKSETGSSLFLQICWKTSNLKLLGH